MVCLNWWSIKPTSVVLEGIAFVCIRTIYAKILVAVLHDCTDVVADDLGNEYL